MIKEKLDDLEQFASTINKLINWTDHSCCHLFYIHDDYADIEKQRDANNAFQYFIKNNLTDQLINFMSVNELRLLSYEDKEKYYEKSYVNIIDCSDLNKENIYDFNNLYDITKSTNANFIYYFNTQILNDYLLSTEQYKLRSYSSFSSLDQDMIAFKTYHELNDKISNKIDNIPIKKKKI